MLLKKEKEVLEYFSCHETRLSRRPFLKMAKDLSMTESELVDMLNNLQKRGIIKYFRGLINHVKAGYRENALIAWKNSSIEDKEEGLVKNVFLTDQRITHCYKRKPHKNFDFGLYTMMHSRTKKEIIDFAKKYSRRFKFDNEVLFTEKELKKKKLGLKAIL